VDDCGKKKSREIAGSKFKKKERKDLYTEDAESTEDPEKIEAKKAMWKEKRERRGRRGWRRISQ
jgi:hypothetical protein